MINLIKIGTLKEEAQYPENVKGVVRFWEVQSDDDNGENWEKSADSVFKKTFITEQLKNTIKKISESLKGERERSNYVFEGTYGTGKSHSLLTIYHIFKQPRLAKEYFPQLTDIEIPELDHIIIFSHFRNEENLWDPIYNAIAPEQKHLVSNGSPSIENMNALIKNKRVLIFFDEMENWFAEKEEGSVEKSQNLNFLQNLSEAVNRSTSRSAVVQTILGRNSELKNILNRNSETINLNIKAIERKQIIAHRLYQTMNEDERKIVINAYAKSLKTYDIINKISDYEEQATASFPFSPFTLEKILETYSKTESSQSVRGALYVCAKALKKAYDRGKDLVLLHDFDINDANIQAEVSTLDAKLVANASQDISNRFQDDEMMTGIISEILIGSIHNSQINGLSINDIVAETARPNITTKSHIEMKLNTLIKKAWYVRQTAERYTVSKEQNLSVRIEEISQEIKQNDDKFPQIKILVSKFLKKQLNNNQMEILFEDTAGDDLERDNGNFKLICTSETIPVEDIPNRYYNGKTYMNAIAVLTPRRINIFNKNTEIVVSASKLLACDALEEMDSTIDKKILANHRKKINDDFESAVKGAYAKLYQKTPGTTVSGMYKDIILSTNDIIDNIEDKYAIKSSIYSIIQASKADGIMMTEISEQMRKFPKHAQFVNLQSIVDAINQLTTSEAEICGFKRIKVHENRYYTEGNFPSLQPDPLPTAQNKSGVAASVITAEPKESITNVTNTPYSQLTQQKKNQTTVQEQQIIRNDKVFHDIRREIESLGSTMHNMTFTYFFIEGEVRDLSNIPNAKDFRNIFDPEQMINVHLKMDGEKNRLLIEILKNCAHDQLMNLFNVIRMTGLTETKYHYIKG